MKLASPSPWRTLRGRFLLVILLGMALPTALLGPWLARTARASGEALLRERLQVSLVEAANAIGHRWLAQRSPLLRLTEDSAVVAALRDARTLALGSDAAGPAAFREQWMALEDFADALTLKDRHGTLRGFVERDGPSGRESQATDRAATASVRLPVFDPTSGERVGMLEARIKLAPLLPAGLWWVRAGGSVLAVFDAAGGTSLAPPSISPELFAADRFEWAGEEWLVAHRRIHEPNLHLALAAPVTAITAPFAAAARQWSIALAGVLIFGLLLSALLTRRVTVPLERLSAATEDVAQGRFGGAVVEQGPEEVRRLGRAFNAMTESLHDTLERLSQREAVAAVGEFAASLAHEVRNPLTSIRLDLERAREKLNDAQQADLLLGRALGQIDRLDASVNGSLRIAGSGALQLSAIPLRKPLEAALHAAEPAFERRGVRLEASEALSTSVFVRGNVEGLERLFLNLLLNAAEALDDGGRVRVRVTVTPTAVRVSVEDTGPGIPAESLERVRDPFFSTKQNGTGLGLAIAQRIASAHEGELQLESVPGTGTTASVVLARETTPGPSPRA